MKGNGEFDLAKKLYHFSANGKKLLDPISLLCKGTKITKFQSYLHFLWKHTSEIHRFDRRALGGIGSAAFNKVGLEDAMLYVSKW